MDVEIVDAIPEAAAMVRRKELEADPVGLQFLLARIAPQLEHAVARHRTADLDRAARHRGLNGGVDHALARLLALGGMALREMAEFVAHRRGQFGIVIDHGEQSAGDEHVATRNRMGIGKGLIEYVKPVGARKIGLADQPIADAIDQRLELRRIVDRAGLTLDRARQGTGPRHRSRVAGGDGLRRIGLGSTGTQ